MPEGGFAHDFFFQSLFVPIEILLRSFKPFILVFQCTCQILSSKPMYIGPESLSSMRLLSVLPGIYILILTT